ncbi:MAG: hypothetical protein IT204_21730 [Fimbriimonadaceae bacterium]|nr:hypothetical protein [Fimbriimonadaceae bacterium]
MWAAAFWGALQLGAPVAEALDAAAAGVEAEFLGDDCGYGNHVTVGNPWQTIQPAG